MAASESRRRVWRGLDLGNYDVTTPEEWEAFRESDRKLRGYPLPSYELLGENDRADAVKRCFTQLQNFSARGALPPPMLLFVHLYAIVGFAEGAVYETQYSGHPKAECVETLAVAFLHAPSNGLVRVAPALQDFLRSYEGPEEGPWPEGWEPDSEFFKSGVDFSTPELRAEELELIEQWHERVTGEVPRYVTFLGEMRPDLLKAYRNRFENTLRVLPKQALPWLKLHYQTTIGSLEGTRDNVLLARGSGMTKAQTFDSIAWGMLYGGPEAIGTAHRAAGDIFESWDG